MAGGVSRVKSCFWNREVFVGLEREAQRGKGTEAQSLGKEISPETGFGIVTLNI